MAGAREAVVVSQSTHVLPLEFNRRYPVIVRGDGVWVEDASGKRYLDAMSGGSMAATLGHGRRDIIAAARAQAEKLAYVHNERLTNPPQEQLAHELAELATKGFTRSVRDHGAVRKPTRWRSRSLGATTWIAGSRNAGR